MAGTTKRLATWVQLKPCYAHAHGCTRAFLLAVIVAFSNFSFVVWTENILSFFSVDEKHLMRFQSETSVFKFLRRSVDGASATATRASPNKTFNDQNNHDNGYAHAF